MTAGLHKLLPDSIGGVIGTDDYQMTIWLPDGHHIDMESDNRNHRRLPHRYGASS